MGSRPAAQFRWLRSCSAADVSISGCSRLGTDEDGVQAEKVEERRPPS